MHVHLDLLGGLAGDMFIAALLDLYPEHELALIRTLASVGASAHRSVVSDGVLRGSRFEVVDPAASHSGRAPLVHAHPPDPTHQPNRHVHHVRWAEIRDRLHSLLTSRHRDHTLGIFSILAKAEAEIHGVAVDEVEFHEVGAWDSIADIVGAAFLIDAIDADRWSVSVVPLGSGRVNTAHGPLPIPAPATALLLRGFAVIDDGVAGERVTPTGAAILRYLVDPARHVHDAVPSRLGRTGIGFGSRKIAGMSNCVRAIEFEDCAPEDESHRSAVRHRELGVIEFEIDDSSAEDIAIGLERLRAHESVIDVIQLSVLGKKGRMMTAVRLLVQPAALDSASEACFRETTTIGLRYTRMASAVLPRRLGTVEVAGRTLRVKTVERPDGKTAKVEADDVRADEGQRLRAQLRRDGEAAALRPVLEFERG